MLYNEQLPIYGFFLLLIPLLTCKDFMGPADIDLKIIEKCADDELDVKSYFLRHKVNRTHQGTDMNLTLPFPIDENVMINVTISKWGDGGWKPNFFDTSEKDVCRYLKKVFPKDTTNIFKFMNHPDDCPIRAGEYSFKDYVYDGEFFVPIFYGDFMCDFTFIKDNTIFMCIRMYCKSSPKNAFKFGR